MVHTGTVVLHIDWPHAQQVGRMGAGAVDDRRGHPSALQWVTGHAERHRAKQLR